MALRDRLKSRDKLIEEAVEISYQHLSDPAEDPRDDKFHLTLYFDQLSKSELIRDLEAVRRGDI